MTKRFEIKSWRKSANDKNYTVRIGSAWVDDKGVTRLAFDALPIPDEKGRVQAFLEEPRENPRQAGAGRHPVEDDSVPFGPEVR